MKEGVLWHFNYMGGREIICRQAGAWGSEEEAWGRKGGQERAWGK